MGLQSGHCVSRLVESLPGVGEAEEDVLTGRDGEMGQELVDTVTVGYSKAGVVRLHQDQDSMDFSIIFEYVKENNGKTDG